MQPASFSSQPSSFFPASTAASGTSGGFDAPFIGASSSASSSATPFGSGASPFGAASQPQYASPPSGPS
ncbi:hypothetical protein, partial [Enterobacter sp. 56-7]|uniref:hypothetical protein n=1 Tax=Enterobacter sp. 56-7 TaxID=1895906 RepID=UPI00257B1ECE